MQNSLLSIENLRTSFFTRYGVANAVDGVDLAIPQGATVGLVGESGCGKSMTAMSVMGLVANPGRVTNGRILFHNEDLLLKSKAELRKITGDKISMIFQEPMTSLNPVKTVGHQVREAILLHRSISRAEARARVVDIFEKVGIPEPERRYAAYPHQLSGGLRQRVMIGMAMACEPDLLIADEPTTALDVTIEAQILRLMKRLQREKNMAILMITHNLGVVSEICDSVYVMYASEVVETADVFALFKEPLHPYTGGLIRSLPSTRQAGERLYNIRGMVPNLLKMPQGCRFCPRCDKKMPRCETEKPPLYAVGDGRKVRCFRYEKGGTGDA
ncbi:MAG: ABC transporter ATP-binding protein [Oscillospiraceae bacterium]|nr:ABC transporter ATP-binding protein [Oscillospiraceae bacterium]